jgi:serine/threonine-protein kinase
MLQRLGKYRIDSVLGTGAMGIVYKGFDPNIERTVALKTIRKELFSDHQEIDLIARFKNEAQAAGRLMHPNIVAVYDYGEDVDTAYIAMEFVDGTPLNSLIIADKPTETGVAVEWITQLLRGLDYAHARGVVHRDIKPANLLITREAQVKVTDFGVARIESSTLTQTGSMIGTPSYMSPEQFRGEAIDGRSDVFSAGIVLYQLLTGTRPFVGSASTVMQKILNEMPVNPSRINPRLCQPFDEVVFRALAKRPAERYASAQVFLEALHAAYRSSLAGETRPSDGNSNDVDSDRTVLATQPPGMRGISIPSSFPPLTHPGTSFAGGVASDASMPTTTGWKLETLPDVEVILSRQVGPMAKLLLKKAAAQANNFDELCDFLLPHIPSEKGRAQFIDATKDIKKKLRSGFSASTLLSSASSASGARAQNTGLGATELPLEQALLDAAERKLTVYMGPIAKVVVKRAARQTSSKTEFFRLLSETLPSDQERLRFMQDVATL